MSFFGLFNSKEVEYGNENKKRIEGVTPEIQKLIDSGVPILSKDGYFWDIHKHAPSLNIISGFLPNQHEQMCHMDLYNYLKRTRVLSEVCIDNFVTNYVKRYPDKSRFILDIAYSVSKKVTQNSNLSHIYPQEPLVDVDKVSQSLSRNNIETLLNNIHTFNSDLDIVNRMGFVTYQHMKHHLYQFEDIDMIDVKDKYCKYEDSIEHVFEILYPAVTAHRGGYLFHGSGYYNWYNIILNGLRVPKNGQVQNGSAHGVAIYTGTSSDISFAYAKQGNSHYGYTAMGLVQTSGRHAVHSGEIKTFVKDDDITLRYVVVMKSSRPSAKILNDLSHKLPTVPNNKKEHVDLFDIKCDDTNIKILGENDDDDYLWLDNGERIYIGNQKNALEKPPDDIPHIVLEDGTILYDQSSDIQKSEERVDIICDDTDMNSDEDIIDINDIIIGTMSILKEDAIVEHDFMQIDEDGRPYILLADGNRLYDTGMVEQKPTDKKQKNELIGTNINRKNKEKKTKNKKKTNKNKSRNRLSNSENDDSDYGPLANVKVHIKKKSRYNIFELFRY